MKIGFKSPKKVFGKIMLMLANLPMPGHWRWKLVKQAGVRFSGKGKYDRCYVFVGENVIFDSAYPEDIEIGNYVHITTGCVLLTHYLDTSKGDIYFKHKPLKIGEGTFIGCNTIIAKPVTIGEHCIIGSGSVVTKDIPSYQIWAGNPARYIKDVERNENTVD
jgi:acetyltransferase-like isoleucine patch superfamily enzyme